METVMKDDHQPDHLEVGLVTPDGTQYSYIPGSKFLWTILPLPHCMYRKCKAFFKGSIILVQVDSILLILFNIVGEQGMAQWWERSPPTNVARVQIPASTHMLVEFVVGSNKLNPLSPLLREVFLRALRFSPLLKNQHFQIPIQPGIRWTKKHFVDVLPPNHYYYYHHNYYYRDKICGHAVYSPTPCWECQEVHWG